LLRLQHGPSQHVDQLFGPSDARPPRRPVHDRFAAQLAAKASDSLALRHRARGCTDLVTGRNRRVAIDFSYNSIFPHMQNLKILIVDDEDWVVDPQPIEHTQQPVHGHRGAAPYGAELLAQTPWDV
jgi:hypothetical protein